MNRGLDARGGETAKDTSASRFATMDAEMQRATTFLNQSVALTRKPYASYYYLVRVGRYTHRPLERRGALDPRPPVRDYLDKAIQIDPRAYWTRVTYMESLQTRWGGSLEAMEHHYQQAEKAGLSQRELNHLRSLVLFEKSWLMDADTQTEERLKLAIEANTLRENIIVLRDIIWLKGRLRRYADALPEMNRALELEPNDRWVLGRRAVAFFVLERHAEAYQDFLINAQRGDAFAQNKVGYYLYKGIGVAENRREAAQWFAKSAAGGDKAGIENLQRAKAEGLI